MCFDRFCNFRVLVRWVQLEMDMNLDGNLRVRHSYDNQHDANEIASISRRIRVILELERCSYIHVCG